MSESVSLVIALPAWTLWLAVGAAYPVVGAMVVWVLRWFYFFDEKEKQPYPYVDKCAPNAVAVLWPLVVFVLIGWGVACVLIYPFYVLANLGRKGQ